MPICCNGGEGVFLGAGPDGSRPIFPNYMESSPVGMAVVYLILLLWFFIGVALAADVFMAAIETITSTMSVVKPVSYTHLTLPTKA